MTAPSWIESVAVEFGRAAGLEGLRLGTRGAAALRFENGVALRIEYTGAELVVSMTAPAGDVRRLLSLSHPRARFGFHIRAGILPKTGEAVLAVRMAERDVTLVRLNAAFELLWRLTGEIGGGAWA